jgi:Flp pilus assembly protein CpaB
MDPREPDRSRRTRLHDGLTTARRAVLRRRRLLAAACAAAAVGAALHATAPPPPPTVEILVASRDLPAGTALEADDVELRAVEPGQVPAGALTAGRTGARLASPLRAGEPVTDVRLVGPDLTHGGDGLVALPVRLSDAGQAALLTVGDEIDLMATDPERRSTVTLAPRAVVLALPPPADGADALTGRLVVLGIPGAGVADVTAAAVTAFVTYAWSDR